MSGELSLTGRLLLEFCIALIMNQGKMSTSIDTQRNVSVFSRRTVGAANGLRRLSQIGARSKRLP
jgi:hypothetical protein